MRNLILLSLLITSNAFAATVIPFERDVPRYVSMDYITSNNYESDHYTTQLAGFNSGEEFFRGFSITNYGPNDVVPTTPVTYDPASRDFEFITEDRSKKETYLWITDYNGSGKISNRYETIITFLPRLNQPHVEEIGEELLVTLSTGEEVVFDKKYKTLARGVLSENKLNYEGGFVDIKYSGKGVMLRIDAKGADPRYSKNLKVIKGDQKPCLIPTNKFWSNDSFPRFKFSSDEETYQLIEDHCGKSYVP